ncbi:hypothetical protein ACFFWD_22390 [Bradyrhizobium erythrophlei]|uniref:hypothetical protein n=1 Tax=Bradyrhizobium erythrophlei TaxID=1437360 RepID=UPI0035F03AF9
MSISRPFGRLFPAAITTLVIANLGFCWLLWFTPNVSFAIPPNQIQLEIGKAYSASLGAGASRLYRPSTDSVASPSASRLALFEEGRTLGPAHSVHADIRQMGGGRFSHWDGALIFSASDGTDPRTNGRVYSIAAPMELKPRLQLLLIGLLTLTDLAFVILFRKDLASFLQRRPALLVVGLPVMIVLLASLTSFGAFGTIVLARDGAPKDGALVLQVLQHTILGCLVSTGIWASGAGIVRLMLQHRHSSLPQVLIPAFPLGLVILAVLLALALVMPGGRMIAFALWIASLAPLVSWRPPRQEITAILRAAICIAPFSVAFGAWLALLWHGPTGTLSGSPSGDLSFYAGRIWSLASQAYPQFDLGYVNAGSTGYFNTLFSALGAALLYLPHFDPFLFLLASGGTCYVLLSALMLHLYVADRAPRSINRFDVLLLTLSVVVAARYPYWVAESIPMVFVPALTISVWWMAERGQHKSTWAAAAMLSALGGSLLSKIVTAAVLVPLGASGIWWRIRTLSRAARLTLFGIAAVFGFYSAAMLMHFVPVFAATATVGPESFRIPRWYFACRDAGAVLMVAAAWIATDWPIALSLSLGIATFISFSFVLQVNFVCVSIVLGLILVSHRPRSTLARTLGLAAFALSLPAVTLADPASASSGIAWIICVGGASLAAVLAASDPIAGKAHLTLRAASVAATTLTVTALGLIGVARGSIIADSGWHLTENEPLTPALREIWSVVRERTPKDALIFTDQVDETEHVLGGWNTYAYSGQRQLYLSSYVTNFELRQNKQKLDEVLATNNAVLEGRRSPHTVATQRTYSAFYAVVAATKRVPPDWRLDFKNNKYALYQIAAP